MRLRRFSLFLFLPLFCFACRSTTPPTTSPLPVQQADRQHFQNQAGGISFMYPTGWKCSTPNDTQFKFSSTDARTGPVELTLDVPKLPWHPAFLLTVDKVRDGYIDDAKKKMPDAQTANLPDPSIPDASVHRIKLTGTINGKPSVNEAVLIVHNDRVYILSVELDASLYPQAVKALDTAAGSIQWVK